MLNAAELGGSMAAHGIWSVSDSKGEPLVPIFATLSQTGERKLERLVGDLEQIVTTGRHKLAAGKDIKAAVLVYDGRITLPQGKVDALLVLARDHESGGSFTMAVPYRPATDSKGFAVFRPKLLEISDQRIVQQLVESFFKGVDSHQKAAEVWNKHADDSL